MTNGKTLNSCDVTFQIYCNDIFLVEMIINSICQDNSNYVLKNEGIWTGFTLETIYMVDILLFLHDVFIMMYIMSYSLVRLLSLSGPKLVFQPQNSRS